MTNKTFSLAILAVLSTMLFVSFAAATTSGVFTITDVVAPTSVAEDAGTFTFTFNLTYTGSSESADFSFADSTTSIGSISIPDATDMNGTEDESRIITGTITNFANQGGNTINVVINASTSGSRDDETTFSVSVTDVTPTTSSICAFDDGVANNPGDLDVDVKDISVVGEDSFGKDDEWLILDDVEIEINVDNKGDWDIDDISLEWGITDNLDGDWLVDLDEIDEFNLKEGKDDTFTVTFTINEKDLDFDYDEFEGSYDLYVRATGTISDSKADEFDNVDTCHGVSEPVSIEGESDFVRLYKIDMLETVSCGDSMPVNAEVWAIGDRDQDDVRVKIFNTELGINEFVDFSTIDSYDKEDLSTTLEIPDDADEKTYILNFEVYDEDNDIYVTDYDDDESKFTRTFTVDSCGLSSGAQATTSVTASLVSGGEAGQPLVVKSTISNMGDKSITYTLNAAGFAEWASSADIDQKTFALNAGDSRDVLITFNVKDDASGTKFFDLEVLSDNQLVTSRPVSVSIEDKVTGLSLFQGNSYLWVIGILNVILIVIIIIVAIRLARR